MGITIHYSGRARSWDDLTQLLTTAQLFAAQREWPAATYDDPMGLMDDVEDKDNPPHLGDDDEKGHALFRGIVIRPHRDCEAVRLQFTRSREVSGFTKTQYAPFIVHEEILELLRAIEPFMGYLHIIDESGLWETGDRAAAEEKFNSLGATLDRVADELRDQGMEVTDPYDLDEYEEDDDDGDDPLPGYPSWP